MGRILAIAWASPCSAVGLVLGAAVLLLGGKVQRRLGVVEFAFGDALAARLARSLRFQAITFGHVVIATSELVLDRARHHELAHVRQYERWGLAFFLAYPAASLWQMLRGRDAYWHNPFEVQARSRSGEGE